ncbi:MAG: VWA domain-containing protein [Bdellovibrionota bacterium]
MRFESPWWFLAFAPLLATAWYVFSERFAKQRTPRVAFSLTEKMSSLPRGPRAALRNVPPVLRLLALALLVVALARPQGALSRDTITTEGIDIVIVLDSSQSMAAQDFEPNRLFAARKVAADFVAGRKGDRIGYVTFATTAITRSPLTADYAVLGQIIEQTQFSNEQQTAIGVALATALNRLRDDPSRSRVVILLTDGQNNAGEIDPVTASELAVSLGVKVYTIGIGRRPENMGMVQRFFGQMPAPVDEKQLRDIAERTGGQYFRAEDAETLSRIYKEISRLETKPIEAGFIRTYREFYRPFAAVALILLVLEFLLRRTYLQGVGV